ncbi:hypothetical protein CGMCC3_g14570 [Colletotrichum fructicola]|nr:uncharacterized protein CGMCC3_g14570 [Colletotrichum fructicola]KAE9569314.1 hypothetical protein CGMCC3_g14570 [Colletotrichum fructicola]
MHRPHVSRVREAPEHMLAAIDDGTSCRPSEIALLETLRTHMALLAEIQWCWAWEDSQHEQTSAIANEKD